jgi:hypothetical protein
MIILAEHIIEKLVQIESGVHYCELPPPNLSPFVVIMRNSPVILSAPHGAITFRGKKDEPWHEEDEYTAGMALLLSEVCGTSVIATTWRTEKSDPNEHKEEQSAYKQALRQLVESHTPRPIWLIDLHGARENSDRLADTQKVDLGMGVNREEFLPPQIKEKLIAILDGNLGKGATDRLGYRGWDAENDNRIAAFTHRELRLHSVQIEMKTSVRVALRRIDSSMYQKTTSNHGGPYTAPHGNVLRMMQSLVEFIEYLTTHEE